MRFVVGCELDELKEYWGRNGYDGDLNYLMDMVIKDSSQLIVWKDDGKIVGHAVWHESNAEEHGKGYARDKEDREALEKLLGGKKDFVELHEMWLIKEYRGRGYGKKFHDFFEKLMKNKGYADIAFYADHPAALAIYRKRGYKEGGYLKELGEYVFYTSLGRKRN